MTLRTLFVAVVAVAGMLGSASVAHAKDHGGCHAGQVWSVSQGTCVKAGRPAAPKSPQKKYDDAVADVQGNGAHPDEKRGAAALDDNCQHNHAPSCTLLGFLYSRGRIVKNDPVKAMELFVKACGMTDIDGCFQVADLAERVGLYAEARTAFVHACDVGSGLGCVRGGDLYRGDSGGEKPNPDQATALYKKGYITFQPQCPGDGTACYALGFLYENGYGITKDANAALAAYRNSCTSGSGEGCVALGNALDAGLGGAVDKDGANQAFTTACESDDNSDACQKMAERLGKAKTDLEHALLLATRACLLDPKYCGTLGEFYRLGLGTTADQDTATSFYKSACDAGAPRWCTSWAERAHDGTGMPKDVAAGISVSQKACDAGDPEGCRQAAGYLAVSDPAKALEAATKGCEKGDAGSCYIAGSYAATVKSFDTAVKLYERACEGDWAPGCVDAAAAYTSGTGTTADPKKVLELTQKACIADDANVSGGACESLVRLFYFGEPKNAESAMYSAARACALGRAQPCDWLGQLAGEVPGDHADLKEFLATACGKGTDGACNAQATLLLRGTEPEKKQGLDLLDSMCARKVDAACLAKADALYNGIGTMPQKDVAEKIYDENCAKGNPVACSNMAIIDNNKKDFEHAFTYAKRACELDSADGCNTLGHFYYTAKGTRWDAAEGVKWLQKACELGSSYGCSNMGYMYRYGVVVPKDGKKALEAYTKSCTPTEQIGCEGAAHYYETGEGSTTVDAKKASDSYRSACENATDPQPIACAALALMLEKQHGAAPEIARLRQKAFDVAKDKAPNSPYTAWMLGTYYRDGVATAKDPARAREWLGKACDGYDPIGCLDAGRAFLLGDKRDHELALGTYLPRACTVGLTEACDLAKAKPQHGGGNLHAKGCGCQGGADGGGVLLVVCVGGLVLRRRRRR